MITSPAFSGRRYFVLGLARSGLASIRSLMASGAEVVAWDKSEDARARAAEIAYLADPTEIDLGGFAGIVVSPGVPLNRHPITDKARSAGVPVFGDVELFAEARASLPPHQVVGVTGTNGKSTTTALIHHIAETAGRPAAMAGNIGYPILEQTPLEANDAGGGIYVLELSSFQLDLTCSLDCDVAVLLNITPDHLDRYKGFPAYFASKLRLIEMQGAHHVAVITDGEGVAHYFDEVLRFQDRTMVRARTLAPQDEGVSIFAGEARIDGTPIARQDDWPALQGPHNAQNAAAAIAAARSLGIDETAIVEGLRSFAGLPHRMERVAEREGVLFVNDSKATNPESTAPALAAFPIVHWILGGLPKTEDLGPCVKHLDHVRAAYTIGEAGPMFARLLEGRVPVRQCELLVEAVRSASLAAAPGEVVLLSPACASFDQFRDYEARGEAFRAAVEALA
ncbi:MAG: UDP-N-acetylmuramoyl-L-alanine--D-glutamate ligase [Sphingosinicella sp.]